MATVKYLTDAILFAPAADQWAKANNILNENGGLLLLQGSNNLSDIVDTTVARINLGLRIGVDVQAHHANLTLLSGGATPSAFSLSLADKANATEWRTALQAGTVNSVSVDGGNTGLVFSGGTITDSGTLTMAGVLSVAHGGTGSDSFDTLKTNLSLDAVDNTRDTDKPISTAVQAALNTKFNIPMGDNSQYVRGDGSIWPFPNIPADGFGTVISVDMSGGLSGLTFSGGPITTEGTMTLSGILNVSHGGTGVSTLGELKTNMALNNVDNTSDLNKPISIATQTALNLTVKIPDGYTGPTLKLPEPEGNMLIGWNATADGLVNIDGSGIVGGGGGPTAVTAYADIFVGDGSTVEYTLTADPGSLENLDITTGGIGQTPGDDYTWTTGRTLTYVSPIPDGEKSVVRYVSAIAVGVDGGEGGGASDAASVTTTNFTGGTIPDGSSVQQALQALVTHAENLTTSVTTLSNRVDFLTSLFDTLPIEADVESDIIGEIYTLQSPFSAASTWTKISGDANLTISGDKIVAAIAIPIDDSQTIIVRCQSGDNAVEFTITLTGVEPAVPFDVLTSGADGEPLVSAIDGEYLTHAV